ncbi:MAG: peptide ABC transporter substrate-binding protein [Oscillospiraceae bacterium]
MILLTTGCFENDGSDGVIKYDIAYNPGSLDPQTAGDEASTLIIGSLYTGLLRVNPDGSLGEGIAEDYIVSEDGLTYQFKLRSDYCWTDVNGFEAPCTAQDFVYGFQRLFDPATRAPRASEYYCIKNSEAISKGRLTDMSQLGVKAVGDYELTITLDYANPRFPVLLTEAPAMPCNEEYFLASQGRYGLSDETTPSNGAFYLRTWAYDPYTITDNNHLILRRNAKNNEVNKVYPSGLNFFIEGDEDFVDDFLSGTISCIAVNDSDREFFKGEYTVQEYDAITVGLLFNTQFGLFRDAEFRRALSCLVDRERLAQAVSGYAAAYAIVPGEVTLLEKSYREFAGEKMTGDYSVSSAQEHYQNARPELDMSLFSGARIIMREDKAATAMISVIMQEWQREFGFYCVVETLTEEEYNSRLAAGDYEIAVRELSGNINSPAAYLQAFTTSGSGNYSGYGSSQVNLLMSRAERAADLSESAELYAKAEQMILDEAAVIPLYYKNEYFYINKDFADIFYNPFNKTIDFTQAKAY